MAEKLKNVLVGKKFWNNGNEFLGSVKKTEAQKIESKFLHIWHLLLLPKHRIMIYPLPTIVYGKWKQGTVRNIFINCLEV